MMAKDRPIRKPAATVDSREAQVISAAIDLAEKQIQEGNVSAQVLTHYLKLGSTRERLEQERLSRENQLLEAKVESMASGKRVEELYEAALNAMRNYAGQPPDDDDYELSYD